MQTATGPGGDTPAERAADRAVHAAGIVLASAGSALLLARLVGTVAATQLVAVSIYLFTLLLSLVASAAYNWWPSGGFRGVLRGLDHSAIFLLIAGTYTPFMVESDALWALGFVWAIAIAGILLKLARPGRFERIAVVLYLALGWSGLLVAGDLAARLPSPTLWLIFAGGVVYSLGVPFHLLQRVPFHTAIWHAFVLAAAGIHFAAVTLLASA